MFNTHTILTPYPPPNQNGRVRTPIPIGIPMYLSIQEYMYCIGTPAVQCMTPKNLSAVGTAWESLLEIPINLGLTGRWHPL